MSLQAQRINAPTAGWNTITPLREMEMDSAVIAENVWMDQASSANRRPGMTPFPAAPAPPEAGVQIGQLAEFNSLAGSHQLFCWTTTGKVYAFSGGAWALLLSGYTTKARFSNLSGQAIIGNGVTDAKKYNGIATSAITTPPNPGPAYIGDIFHTHAGRVFAAGDSAQRLTVYFSASNAASGIDYWSSIASGSDQGGFIDVSGALREGDQVTGLTSFQGFLVVLCKRHIVFYNANDPINGLSVNKVVQGIGCLTQDSVQGIGNDVIFLSEFGFKSLNQVYAKGDAVINDKSVPINNFVTDQINQGNITASSISSTYNGALGVYLCQFGDRVLVFHTLFNAWTYWTGLEPILFSSADGTLYSAGEYAHSMSVNNMGDKKGAAAEVAIPFVWQPPPFRGGDLESKPRWNRVEIIFRGQANDTVLVEHWLDEDQKNSTTETITINPDLVLPTVNTMQWGTGVASTNPLNKWWISTATLPKWVGTIFGTGDFLGGDERFPVTGRSELFNVKVRNTNISKFSISAIEVYRNDGGLR